MSTTSTHRGVLPPGTRVQELEFRQVVGKPGGFGVTYCALDTRLDKIVAIKEYMPAVIAVREPDGRSIHPRSDSDRDEYGWGLDAFLEEARMLARFDHPGIVRVFRFFEAHGTAYIVMEYIEGRTLAEVHEAEKTLSESRLRALVTQVLEGLEQVHATGFLHRDIKPGNIMLRNDGTPVLIDFGAARVASAERSRSITAVMTPGYAPIEQYGGGEQGPWTDIYAVGAVLHTFMTGKVPVDAAVRAGEDDSLVPVGRAAAREYGKPLLDAVEWALQVRRTDRPKSIGEWRKVLDGHDLPPPVEPSGPAAKSPAHRDPASRSSDTVDRIDPSRPPPRSRRGRWLATLGALMLVAGGAYYWWYGLSPWWTPTPPEPPSEPGSVPDPGLLEQKMNEVDARLEEEDFAAARAHLAEARTLGLSDEDHEARAAAIDAAERDALLAQVDARLEEGDFATARARLAEARALGLPDEDHEAQAAAIDTAEAATRAEEVARLLDSCEANESAGQAARALACFRQVLALDPENAVAMAGARRLDDLAAWKVAVDEDSVEAYYAFEQSHPGSVYADLARKKLGELELEYWNRTVKPLDTPRAYARYLEIYPEGVFVGLAKLRAAQEG